MSPTDPYDLLADLRVDQRRAPLPELPAPPAASPAPVRTPALEVRVTPLHWTLPGGGHTARGWLLRAGPVEVALALHG